VPRELDWVFVDDVVDGLLTVAHTEYLDGRTIDIGSGRLTTIREIIDRVLEITGSSVPIHYGSVPDRPLERPRAACVETTARQTGWVSRTPLHVGLTQTVAWYRQQVATRAL
jgi:UDP-glucose 4-epimerase